MRLIHWILLLIASARALVTFRVAAFITPSPYVRIMRATRFTGSRRHPRADPPAAPPTPPRASPSGPSAAPLSDGVSQVLRHVELVEHDLAVRVRHVSLGGSDVRGPHVHHDALEPGTTLRAELLEKALQRLLATVVRHVEHDLLLQ